MQYQQIRIIPYLRCLLKAHVMLRKVLRILVWVEFKAHIYPLYGCYTYSIPILSFVID